MAQLYLIRHARAQMTGDAPQRWNLSEKGQREAGVLARQDFWRAVKRIFSSPAPKSLQTVEPAARRWGIPLHVVDCLHDLRRHSLVYDYEDVIAHILSRPEASIAESEPATRAAERITGCIKRLVTAHPEETIAVASHGLALTIFLAQLENRWPTVAEWRAVPFAGVAILDSVTWKIVQNWSNASEIS